MEKTIKDCGEQGVLKLLQAFCPSDIIGDDGAVLPVPPEQQLVVTTDMLVEGVHFSDRTTSAEDVGWRAVTANLSDLAAMGALPLGITVGLGLTEDKPLKWLESLYQGMANCLNTYGGVILGGDICRSSKITVSITALGWVFPQKIIRRSTAQVGDAILVTGYHGLSRGGLDLLVHPEKGSHLAKNAKNKLINAHQRPKPRLDVIEILQDKDYFLSIAGMDSSDGLADAIIQICRCSEVGAQIQTKLLPLASELAEWVGEEPALDWTLYGGEDFELVLCLPRENAERLIAELGEEAAIIGEITKDKTVRLMSLNSSKILTLAAGFQHFGQNNA